MKYTTLFRNLTDASGFNITNIPWIGYEMERESNLICNEEGKKLLINDGEIEIVDARPPLIIFTGPVPNNPWSKTFYAEEGMRWIDWLPSDYNTDGYRQDLNRNPDVVYCYGKFMLTGPNGEVDIEDEIIPNYSYSNTED